MASRKDEKARLRQEREDRERAAAAGARRKRLVGYGVAGVLGVAALVAVIVVAMAGGGSGSTGNGGGNAAGDKAAAPVDPADVASSPIPPQRITDLAQATKAARCTTRKFASEGRDHVPDEVTYKSDPPHSGPHDPIPIEDGIFTDVPREENAVHGLEHGRILLEYKPTASEETKGQMKALFDEDPYHMILLPNPKMPYEVAAVAWTNVLGCKQANPQVFDAIRAFKERYRDRGPEFVP